jgi:hypothetical protein
VVNPSRAPTTALSTPWKGGRSDDTMLGVSTRTRALNSQMVGKNACVVAIVPNTFAFSASDQSSGETISMGPEG